MTPQIAHITAAKEAIRGGWCVYSHTLWRDDGTHTLIYINACRTQDVFTLAMAHRNSEWVKMVNDTTNISVTIVAIGTQAECQSHAHRLTREQQPICNIRGYLLGRGTGAIICSNGKKYATQTEAAKELGIAQGQLSRHLRGEGGPIKGYTFTREHFTP